MMKFLQFTTAMILGLSAMHVFADPVEDQFKTLIKPQATYAQFQKNFDTILGEIEEISERGNRTKDMKEIYPMCVAMKSAITVMKNNQKFKAEFDKDYKKFDTSYNDTLAYATKGLSDKKQACADGKKYYFAQ